MRKTFGARVARARRILTGEPMGYGSQRWFGEQLEGQGFTKPSNQTVHRWITGGAAVPTEEAEKTLAELELQAHVQEKVLRKALRAAFKARGMPTTEAGSWDVELIPGLLKLLEGE